MFEQCANCGGKVMVRGCRDEHGVPFCSWQCRNYFRHRNFCARCFADTTSENAGGASTINSVGTMMFGWGAQCPDCGSVVQTKCFCFFFPLIPLGTYRVLYRDPRHFFSRRLSRPTREPIGSASPFAASPAPLRATASTAPAPYAAADEALFRCPHCGSSAPAVPQGSVSAAGWVLFAVLLLFCFPLCWLGLLFRDHRLVCSHCRRQVG